MQRYLKLTELNHGLLELVDQGRIPVAAGAELTKLSQENQEALLQYLSENPEQGVKDKDLPLLLAESQTGDFDSSSLAQVFQAAPKSKREKKPPKPRKEQEPVEKMKPTEVHVNGLVFVFHSDTALMEWLNAHADEMYEEG